MMSNEAMDQLGAESEKIVLGVTGSFGSGKNTVAAMLAEQGAQVIDADRLAHDALEPGSPVHSEILRQFPDAVNAQGVLERCRLAEVVFKDAMRLKALEALIHPYVFRRIDEETVRARAKWVVLNVPLLYETGLDKKCRLVIYVHAPVEKIRERLMQRGFSEDEIQARQQAQMAPDEKIKKADAVIKNGGPIQKTRDEVVRLFGKLPALIKGAK